MAFTGVDLDMDEFGAMLKELYPAGVPQNVAVKRHPFLAMVKKLDDFEGDALVLPIIYENPGGRSATFLDAQTYANASRSKKWTLTQIRDYAVINIDALTIRASRSNKGAFLNARKMEVDLMLKSLGNSAAHACYRSGYGALGQISNDPDGTGKTVTLIDNDDARNFAVGGAYVFAAAADGTTPSSLGTKNELTGVNEKTGVLTFATVLNGDVDANDYIFQHGDVNTVDSTKLKMTGLAGWLPVTDPVAAESFFGVDRSIHRTRLAGHVVDATGNSIEENILTLSEEIVRQGGHPEKCFISHSNFSNLIKGLGTKVEYHGAGGQADIGFGGVQIHTSAGPVMVHPDPDCPNNRGYVLQMDTWAIHHLDAFPHIDNTDGNSALRQSSADGIEVRARYWAQLACIAPGWNGVFTI